MSRRNQLARQRHAILRRAKPAKGGQRKEHDKPDPYQKAARAAGYRARSAYKLIQINRRYHLLKPGMAVLDLGAAPGGWSQVAARLVSAAPLEGDKGEGAKTNGPGEGGLEVKKKGRVKQSATNNTRRATKTATAGRATEPVEAVVLVGPDGSDGSGGSDGSEGSGGSDGSEEPDTRDPECLKRYLKPMGLIIGVDLDRVAPLEGCTFLRGDLTEKQTLEALGEKLPPGTADAVISDMSPKLSGNYDMDQARSVHLAHTALDIAKTWLKPKGNFLVKVFEGADFQDFRAEVKANFASVRLFSPAASRKASSEIYLVARGFKPARG